MRRQYSRHHVERDQPLIGIFLPINVECNAGFAEKSLRLGSLAVQTGGIFAIEPAFILAIGLAQNLTGP